jgi:Dolichyl-phosphate-mannose-protein mannosyltransferase
LDPEGSDSPPSPEPGPTIRASVPSLLGRGERAGTPWGRNWPETTLRDGDPGLPNWIRRGGLFLLLALFALQVFLTSRQTSPAYDEVAVLPAGYVFLRTGQWRVIPEHPPLIPALSALPLLALNLRLDLADPHLWRARPNPWNVGEDFLALNDDDDVIFLWARLPVLLLALLLGYFVYRWARELYGDTAGLVALGLYAFCPTMVAHSGFASLDVGLACFFTLSLYGLWRFIGEGTWNNLLWAGVLLGCALASKGSAVVLGPVFVILMLLAVRCLPVREPAGEPSETPAAGVSSPLAAGPARDRLLASLGALAAIFLVAWGVLYTIYLFPTDPLFYVRSVLLGQVSRPPAYLYYLMGRFRPDGWWYYFLVAYAVKTPLPMLLLIPLAVWHWGRRGRGWFHEVFLLLPALALVTLVSAAAYPVGVRYLIPAYPLLFIFVSRTAPLFVRSRLPIAAGVVLAAWLVSTPVRFHPDYLAYFNELVGGPRHGIEYLDDSNIEWGQHLKRVKRYLDEHRAGPVKLAYFTTGRPEYYGIHAERMQLADLARSPAPGLYIMGAYDLIWARAYYGIDWLERYTLVDTIGYSIYVFNVP